MDRRDRHAGCYKDFNNGFVYFNKLTNPTETTPDLGKIGRRAICIDDGNVLMIKLIIIFLDNIF